MRIDVVTIFGAYLEPLRLSLVGRAISDGLIDLRIHDLRDFTHDRHRTVDDSPYGGGPGMLMKPEPWGEAITSVLKQGDPTAPVRFVLPTPSGRRFTQEVAQQWSQEPRLLFACGRYEGIDSRVPRWVEGRSTPERPIVVDEVSIGDYVLAGAEAAVLVMVEALARLVPGVLGNETSHADDSFAAGGMEQLLEGPVYTRPPVWEGMAVPDVLLSGDHGAIARWRREQAQERTARVRPDLLPDAAADSSPGG